jgi:hypothetical protein
VQTYALVILNHLDAIERAQAEARSFKHSLIASGDDWDWKKLFPEYNAETTEEVRELAPGEEIPEGADIDLSKVEWKSPSDDPEEFQRLMEYIQRRPGTFSGNDVVTRPDEPVKWSEWQ